MLECIVTAGGLAKSYEIASRLLLSIGELKVSARQINHLVVQVGNELQATRDATTTEYLNQPLPRQIHRVVPEPILATVELDGGRMQTREMGLGPGANGPHWRETKNAGFFRMCSKTYAEDPHPELPSCFANQRQMLGLFPGLVDATKESCLTASEKPDLSWRPVSLFRTCLSSLVESREFGPLMAAEADQRGFYAAAKRAFLGDGLAYNWTIQRQYFPTFTPIVDFIHPLERLYETSRALSRDETEAWTQYVSWAENCWQGNVSTLVELLKAKQVEIGDAPEDADENDPRIILANNLTYLINNASRMNYPEYRKNGLPTTSCLIESLVKEVNYRVKGTEKFWNDGEYGEAILQVRAALLSDDDRLQEHIRKRPGDPFARKSRKRILATAA